MRMQLTKLLTLTLLFIAPVISYSQTTPGAVEYLDQLLASFDEMEGAKWSYLKAVTRGRSARKVEKRRSKLISKYATALTDTRKVRSFQKDSLLKPALTKYLKFTKSILKEDYDKILDMEAIAEESYDAMEAYIMVQEEIDKKLTEASDILSDGQSDFADLHGIRIIEGERSKRAEKIAKASAALGHYNEVFLIFFKANVQESNFLAAMAAGDVVAMDQSSNALLTYAEEGQTELDKVELIKNDRSLVNGAKNVLKFYKSEITTDFKQLLDFYLVKDEFEKAQKEFDSIKKSKRTQAHVDKINKASKKYNQGVNKVNSTLERNNSRRNTTLNNWEKIISSFFDRNN